jgi:MerR family transcriptional regulator, redox-sensitive transcriptional activator SoxR
MSNSGSRPADQAALTIGAVARLAGKRPSSIRYYEQIGVLPAPPRVGGRMTR